ncbi:MAG: M50 family metallopeptidase [Nanoarchaeota archaeon]|nr:M50 family metallopeptidase [Nanoarchaeota archaeon]
MGLNDFKYRLKKNFKFNKDELVGIVAIAIAFGFIASFREWGYGDEFELFVGLRNLINATIISFLAILTHEVGHKVFAISKGYTVSFKPWWSGMLIAIVLCFMSRGHIWFFAISGITIKQVDRLAVGKYRYGMRPKDILLIALAGPVASIILATLIKTPSVWFSNLPFNLTLINKAFTINWAIAVFNLLPIPPLDGIHILFTSRLTYATILGFVIGYGALLYFGIYSWILAIGFAALGWLLFYLFFERSTL